MNPHTPEREEHVAEGDLVRYLDDELSVAERGQVASHLIGCAKCAGSLDSLRAERRQFEDFVSGMEIPPLDPARRRDAWAQIERASRRRAAGERRSHGSAMLRAAAVAAILFVSAFTTSPVRAWVADLWRSLSTQVERLAGGGSESEEARFESVSLNNATIGFVPTGDVFVIEVRNPQRQGTLILSVGEGVSVTVRAVGDGDSVDVARLSSGLQIENRPDHQADYAVNLPAHLAEVRVRIGDASEIVYRMDEIAASWISVIDLSPVPAIQSDALPRP